MSKSSKVEYQPEFELHVGSSNKDDSENVRPFVDSQTQAVRRDAIERVRASGIFQLPSPRRL
jgi:hypothetical protein